MSSNLLNDPEHWRLRAKKAREPANTLSAPEERERMLGVARNYDDLAAHAAERVLAPTRARTGVR